MFPAKGVYPVCYVLFGLKLNPPAGGLKVDWELGLGLSCKVGVYPDYYYVFYV